MSNQNGKIKVFSTFSGIGGFELGIIQAIGERADFVAFSEINKYAISIYQHHFKYAQCETCNIRCLQQNNSERPRERNDTENELQQRELSANNCTCKHKNYGDIKKIKAEDLPDFDLLTGGTPCQDLSIAGKRKGLVGERSGLFTDYVRILKAKKPRYFIWENVKGALSSNNGWDFATVINSFAEAGYVCQWQVLNAKDFGVPQNRERIFVVGSRGESTPQVFPIGEDGGECDEVDERQSQVTGTINSSMSKGGNKQDSNSRVFVREINQLNTPTHSNDRVYSTDGISPTLNTAQGGNRQPFVSIQRCGDRDKDTYSVKDVAHTLSANPMSDYLPKVTDGVAIRRLTTTECERLMSFPDGWTEKGINEKGEEVLISDTQRYKTLGNGVVSNVVAEIVKRMI